MALRHREASGYSPPRSDEEKEGILEKVEGIRKI